MQKNWYVIYTKAKCEKKVAALLTKRKIENFCPLNGRQVRQYTKLKFVYEPLFTSWVFVYICQTEISGLKEFSNVINLVYWKNKPVIVQNEEIEEIQEFVSEFQEIKLERNRVDLNKIPNHIGKMLYSVEKKVLKVKNTSVKLNLFSLGITIYKEIDDKGFMGKENGVEKRRWLSGMLEM